MSWDPGEYIRNHPPMYDLMPPGERWARDQLMNCCPLLPLEGLQQYHVFIGVSLSCLTRPLLLCFETFFFPIINSGLLHEYVSLRSADGRKLVHKRKCMELKLFLPGSPGGSKKKKKKIVRATAMHAEYCVPCCSCATCSK